LSEQERSVAVGERLGAVEKPARQPKYNWEDPSIPAGDAPSMPRWPLVLSVVAWCGWLAFLVVMMLLRLRTTPI